MRPKTDAEIEMLIVELTVVRSAQAEKGLKVATDGMVMTPVMVGAERKTENEEIEAGTTGIVTIQEIEKEIGLVEGVIEHGVGRGIAEGVVTTAAVTVRNPVLIDLIVAGTGIVGGVATAAAVLVKSHVLVVKVGGTLIEAEVETAHLLVDDVELERSPRLPREVKLQG